MAIQKCKELTNAQYKVIDWYAAKGMLYWDMDEQDVVKRPTAVALAKELGISRQTIYDWPKVTPDFDKQVEQASKAILQLNIGAVWNGVFTRAADGDPKAAEMYLSYFDPTFKLPARQSVEVKEMGLGDLLAKARQKMASTKVAQV